MRNIAQRINY